MEKSPGMGRVSQTELAGASHSNVGHVKMYLAEPRVSCLVSFPFLLGAGTVPAALAAMAAFQRGRGGEWPKALLKCLVEI